MSFYQELKSLKLNDAPFLVGHSGNTKTKTLDYTCIEKSVVVCHNSDVYVLENLNHNLDIAKEIEDVYDRMYKYYIQLYDENLAITKATDIVYEVAKDRHVFDLRELINEKR